MTAPDTKQSTTMTMRLTPTLKARMEQEAAEAGISLNKYVVSVLGSGSDGSVAGAAKRIAGSIEMPVALKGIRPSACRLALKKRLIDQLTAEIERGVEEGLPGGGEVDPYDEVRRNALREANDPAQIEIVPTADQLLASNITVSEFLALIAPLRINEDTKAAQALLSFAGADLIEARDGVLKP